MELVPEKNLKIATIGKHVVIDVDYKSWWDVKKEYVAVKKIADSINILFGHIMACYMVKAILYYAISLNKVADWIKMTTVVLYFFGASSILMFSADVCRQVFKMH